MSRRTRSGGRSRSKRGGNMLKRMALPGLLTLGLLSMPKKHRKSHKRRGTRKGMVRKTASRAYIR